MGNCRWITASVVYSVGWVSWLVNCQSVFFLIYLAYEASEIPRICTTSVRMLRDFTTSSPSSSSSSWPVMTRGGRCVSQIFEFVPYIYNKSVIDPAFQRRFFFLPEVPISPLIMGTKGSGNPATRKWTRTHDQIAVFTNPTFISTFPNSFSSPISSNQNESSR